MNCQIGRTGGPAGIERIERMLCVGARPCLCVWRARMHPSTEIGLAGVDILSHKKKAVFWRTLTNAFPTLIDYLCNEADLGQVRCVHLRMAGE